MTAEEDEILKAACHGLLLGCVLPVFAYNLGARRWLNVAIYGALAAYEVKEIAGHLQATQSTPSPSSSA